MTSSTSKPVPLFTEAMKKPTLEIFDEITLEMLQDYGRHAKQLDVGTRPKSLTIPPRQACILRCYENQKGRGKIEIFNHYYNESITIFGNDDPDQVPRPVWDETLQKNISKLYDCRRDLLHDNRIFPSQGGQDILQDYYFPVQLIGSIDLHLSHSSSNTLKFMIMFQVNVKASLVGA